MSNDFEQGEPVICRATETRLSRAEIRCDELREESLRRGRTVLEQSEKIRALEREIDEVRRQLGAEILRADEAPSAAMPSAPADRAAIIAEVLPAWEAVYEPGNVSDYLIGYANDEAPAKAAAEVWLRSQAEVTGRLEWVPEVRLAVGEYDQWFELIERQNDGIDTGPGLIVRRRAADEAQQPDGWQQCPASEFDGYGLQCQKEAGHNLCTFEEPGQADEEQQPTA